MSVCTTYERLISAILPISLFVMAFHWSFFPVSLTPSLIPTALLFGYWKFGFIAQENHYIFQLLWAQVQCFFIKLEKASYIFFLFLYFLPADIGENLISSFVDATDWNMQNHSSKSYDWNGPAWRNESFPFGWWFRKNINRAIISIVKT